MLGNLTGWHLVAVLAVVLVLFGAPKLPGLARSLGQSMRIFRSEVKTMKEENASESVADDEFDVEPEPASTAAPKPAARKTTTTKSTSTAAKPKP